MEQALIPTPRGTTRLFVILGDPVAQVQAPALFNRIVAEVKADAVMVPIHVAPAALADVMRGLKRIGNLDGMLVTVPHKFAVCEHLDRKSAAVELAGAANAIRRDPDGKWAGENFDGRGFVAGLRNAGYDPARSVIALVGAGGAGSAIAAALVEANVRRLIVSDLAPEKAACVAARLNEVRPGTVHTAHGTVPRDADVVVNCTPLGLEPDDPLPFAVDDVRADALVADIIMEPAITRLLATAHERGLATHRGIHMPTPQMDLYARFFGIGDAPVDRNSAEAGHG